MRLITNIDYFGDGDKMHLMGAHLPDCDNFPTLIYFHGGGLYGGDRKECKRILELTEKGIAVVSAEYRMFPDNHFPDFLFDAAAAVKYTISHIKEWGGNGKVFISGASAGAYITMMLSLNHEYFEHFGIDCKDITGFISESAQQFAHYNVLASRGFDSRIERIDETAPINYVGVGLDIRPTLLIYYTDDMECRPEENRLMYASMRRLSEDKSLVSIKELEGTHCNPKNHDELVDTYYSFILEN